VRPASVRGCLFCRHEMNRHAVTMASVLRLFMALESSMRLYSSLARSITTCGNCRRSAMVAVFLNAANSERCEFLSCDNERRDE
jgi:hypothetical protein